MSLVVFPACLLAIIRISKRVRKSGAREVYDSRELMVGMQESFAGIRLVKAYARKKVVAMAHRLSTILEADQIIVTDQGHFLDRGTHAELLGRNAVYQNLYDLPFSSDNKRGS